MGGYREATSPGRSKLKSTKTSRLLAWFALKPTGCFGSVTAWKGGRPWASEVAALQRLNQDFLDDAAVDIGQSEVATGVTVGQASVIDAHLMQDRSVQIVNIDFVTHD